MVPRERSRMNRLLEEGVPLAEVARRLGRSRQTLYNWLRREQEGAARPRRRSKLDPFKPYIESRLARFDLPAATLLREIRERGYEGGSTILKEFVAGVKSRHVQRVVDRFETEPGRQAQIDWASCGTILHRGRRRRLSLFTLVLGYSRVIWARFVVSERRPALLELLEQAFRELGGVPRELLVDNMKQVVRLAGSADRPAEIQPAFADFAEHWGFEVVACPPYWPRAKGKVERAIGYIKRSFLEGREFRDLEDLNMQLRVWLSDVANVRRHGTVRERPVDRFAADQAAMRPVAGRAPWGAAEVALRYADHDARLSFRGVRYSVDPEVLGGRRGTPVRVERSTDGVLRFYHEGRLVGEHREAAPGSPPQDDPAHAAARRRLHARPPGRAPRERRPRFAQRMEQAVSPALPPAPLVQQRPLSCYEGVR